MWVCLSTTQLTDGLYWSFPRSFAGVKWLKIRGLPRTFYRTFFIPRYCGITRATRSNTRRGTTSINHLTTLLERTPNVILDSGESHTQPPYSTKTIVLNPHPPRPWGFAYKLRSDLIGGEQKASLRDGSSAFVQIVREDWGLKVYPPNRHRRVGLFL